MRCVQAVAIAALYLACKLDNVSGSGYPTHVGVPEDPFPDKDRGSAAALIRECLRWSASFAGKDKRAHPQTVRPTSLQ